MPRCPKCWQGVGTHEHPCRSDRDDGCVDHQPLIKHGDSQLWCPVCERSWDDWPKWPLKVKNALKKIKEIQAP